MKMKIFSIISSLMVITTLLLSGCNSGATITVVSTLSSTSTPVAQATQSANAQTAGALADGNTPSGTPSSGSIPGGNPPGGTPGNSAAPGGGSDSISSAQALSTATGAYTLDGKTATQSGQTYTASKQDESAIYVMNGGNLSITDATISTSANAAKLADLTLDGTSHWTVTADSYLSCLTDRGGISGSSVSNITGNGHSVYYNASACTALNGQTYTFVGGGYLKPAS
jgi:hypothetical protein